MPDQGVSPGGYLGVDAGSTTVKAVVVDEAGAVMRTHLAPASGDYARDIAQALAAVAGTAGYRACVATGYAQDLVPGVLRTLSEISCHARGAHHVAPATELVLDIGGQDCKAIRLGAGGKPTAFQMNDKCAAGTGRFLDVMARALGCGIGELADLAAQSAQAAKVSSMCTVFAESEVISLLSRNTPKADIARGLLEAIAERVSAMAARLGPAEHILLTGGVAQNAGVVAALSQRLRVSVQVPAQPQLTGALGAALAAREMG
jgi:(R)-2-hydroxyacyl-CoA dehydratese activating ATPase